MTTTFDPRKFRYTTNGLYPPRATDFLPEENLLVDVPGFLEACCVRLERLFPDVSHVAGLCREMRTFAGHETMKEFAEWPSQDDKLKRQIADKDTKISELEYDIGELRGEIEVLQYQIVAPLQYDDSLPE